MDGYNRDVKINEQQSRKLNVQIILREGAQTAARAMMEAGLERPGQVEAVAAYRLSNRPGAARTHRTSV